jgi:hypothetical protein
VRVVLNLVYYRSALAIIQNIVVTSKFAYILVLISYNKAGKYIWAEIVWLNSFIFKFFDKKFTILKSIFIKYL